jgi:hypothetical protein
MTNSSFTQKILQIRFTLTSGTFDGMNNQVTLDGLRMECDIEKGGHPSKNKGRLKIFGMLESDMNKLTTVPTKAGKPLVVHKNIVQVLAGDASGLTTAFEGEISAAWASYQSPPNMDFVVEAIEGYYSSIAPIGPTSRKGSVPVATLMAGLAAQMGYSFQNNGVRTVLSNPYLTGSAWQQAADLTAAANIEFGIDNGVLFIAPRGAPRNGTAPFISPTTGLKEYPVFDKKGLKFETLYNPSIILGGLVVIQSAIPVACGTWRIHGLKHKLSTLMPNGKWETSCEASYVGSPT